MALLKGLRTEGAEDVAEVLSNSLDELSLKAVFGVSLDHP